MSRRLHASLALSMALGLLACEGPTAGELTGQLETSHTNTGAIAFAVQAAEPETVADVSAACAGCEVFSRVVSEREVRGVVVGEFGSGPLFRVTVSDVDEPTLYSARVLEAALADFTPVRIGDFSLRLVGR